jgi:hypothetical protein
MNMPAFARWGAGQMPSPDAELGDEQGWGGDEVTKADRESSTRPEPEALRGSPAYACVESRRARGVREGN